MRWMSSLLCLSWLCSLLSCGSSPEIRAEVQEDEGHWQGEVTMRFYGLPVTVTVTPEEVCLKVLLLEQCVDL